MPPNKSLYPNAIDKLTSVSATRIESFEQCHRKYYFSYVARLPEPQQDYFHFGTGLHTLSERFHKTDASGRDEKGNVVDIFAPGWEKVYGDGKDAGKVVFIYSKEEQEHIKKLVEYAIERGVWGRRPGREIEKEINLQIPYETLNGEEAFVTLRGFIDIYNPPNEIQDHKTAKNSKYVKSPASLGLNWQVRIYAWALREILRASGQPIPAKWIVRHNVFLKKEAPGLKNPRIVQAELSNEDLDATYEAMRIVLKDMRRLCEVVDHSLIPDPDPKKGTGQANACMAFGGCQFTPICTRRESIAEYSIRINTLNKERMERLNGERSAQMSDTDARSAFTSLFSKTSNQENPDMGPFDKLNAIKAAKTSQAAPVAPQTAPNHSVMMAASAAPAAAPVAPQTTTTTTVTNTPVPAPQAAPVVAPEKIVARVTEMGADDTVPWAKSDCLACKSNQLPGFTSTGTVCRICANQYKVSTGRKVTDDFLFSGQPFEFEFKVRADGYKAAEDEAPAAAPAPTHAPDPIKTIQQAASQLGMQSVVINDPKTAPVAEAPKPSVLLDERPIEMSAPAVAPNPETMTTIETLPTEEEPELVGRAGSAAAMFESAIVSASNAAGTVPGKKLRGPSNPKGAGRKKQGYRLCLGCIPARVSGPVQTIEEIFAQFRQRLCMETGVIEYYEQDAFRRRDQITAMAQQVFPYWGKSTIVCGSIGSTDMKALVDVLKEHAFEVFVSTIG